MISAHIKIAGLTKKYKKKIILKNINIAMNAGDIFALVGINGSGKTTLLSILSGLMNCTEGRIQLDCPKEQKGPISMSHQKPILYPYLSGKDNLKTLAQDYSVACGILNKLNPDEKLLYDRVSKLSSGQQQCLNLAVTLAQDASLYMLDEPTTGLDMATQRRLISIIKEMADIGKIFILASHEWNIIEQCCNRLGILNDGKIEEDMNINDSQEEQTVTFTLKTNHPCTYAQICNVPGVNIAYQLDKYNWKIRLDSKKYISEFQQFLLENRIGIEEWSYLSNIQNSKKVYQDAQAD